MIPIGWAERAAGNSELKPIGKDAEALQAQVSATRKRLDMLTSFYDA